MGTEEEILVGVSGSPGSSAAVRYAAHEAARTGVRLRIVHVAPAYRPLISLYPSAASVTPAEVEALGHAILLQAWHEAQWYLAEEDVERVLATGERARGLLAASGDVRMMVLGRTQGDAVRRVATGRLVASVVEGAMVPVVVVPEDWAPSQPRGRLLVGVKRLDAIPAALIRAALRLAEQRNAEVEIVHVAAATHDLDDAATSRRRRAEEAVAQEVDRRLGAVYRESPTVPVTVRVVSGEVATYLVGRSAAEDALVLSRGVGQPSGGHGASVGSAVVRSARCPVVVVPVADEPTPTAARETERAAVGGVEGLEAGEERRDEFA